MFRCWQLFLIYRNTKRLTKQNSITEKHCSRWSTQPWNQRDLNLDLQTSCGPEKISEHLQASMTAISAFKTHVHSNKIIMVRSWAQCRGTCLCPFSLLNSLQVSCFLLYNDAFPFFFFVLFMTSETHSEASVKIRRIKPLAVEHSHEKQQI